MLLASLAAAFALHAAHAYGDPPQGASDPCRSRSPGDPCEADDFEGVCKRRRCTRETDDGVRSFHCLVCESRRHHSSHRDAGARHHRRDEALDAAVEAPDVTGDVDAEVNDAPQPDDVRDAMPLRVADASTTAPRAARRGRFACAARPGEGAACGSVWAMLVLVVCGRVRARRAAASAP
jgi:hypothetical protein